MLQMSLRCVKLRPLEICSRRRHEARYRLAGGAREKHMHNLRLLTVFAQAARSGSFTMAAKVLHCTPGLVSKSVAQLEQDAGIRLFNRTTRRLNLTQEGAEFYNAVRLGLEQLERADDVSAAARNQVDGLVRLAIGGAIGKTPGAPAAWDGR